MFMNTIGEVAIEDIFPNQFDIERESSIVEPAES
jgi:hypothetical protein